MLNIQIRPIALWPGTETKNPTVSNFWANFSQTMELLERELKKADAVEGSLLIEMWVDARGIRLDGQLRASARVQKPGIIFRFTRRTGKLLKRPDETRYYETQDVSYPCDAFDDWQDNLRAIALSMESLRRVERYGVFKYNDIISRLALPSAEGKISSRDAAAAFLSQHSGVPAQEILFSDTARSAAYRKAAHELHPDKTGGVSDDFVKLTEANQVLTTVTAG